MITHLSQLDEHHREDVAAARHAAWGEGDLGTTRARLDDVLERSDGAVTLSGLVDDGRVICSLERTAITLASPEGDQACLGIGAVVTNADRRGEGHARTLIDNVVGASAALVFSDVDPAFYENLGFKTLSHVTWSARIDALDNRPARVEPTRDAERLRRIFLSSWRPGWLYAKRTADRWTYATWRYDIGDAFLIGDDDYVIVRQRGDTLWVDEACTPSATRSDLWASLRMLGTAMGATRVTGWLRPEHAGGPFVATQRKRCIPMIRTASPLGDVRTHFGSLDQV